MKEQNYYDSLLKIQKEEYRLALQCDPIEESIRMIAFLQNVLQELKGKIITLGFPDKAVEIEFFKKIKPQILGKLIYYNKIYKIETGCPVKSGKVYSKYISTELQDLKQEYNEHISNSSFFRYYSSGRTDCDIEYFTLGQINIHNGVSSYVFEIDNQFSTYYDYQIAKIIANELLYTYLLSKASKGEGESIVNFSKEFAPDFFWTDSKNALIELIYALHVKGCISHGKVGIRKIAIICQILFRIDLGEFHHAFHRMKSRAGSKTTFLDQLKDSLEEYMNKDL